MNIDCFCFFLDNVLLLNFVPSSGVFFFFSGLPLYTSVPNYGHWPGDPNLSGFHMSESDYQQTVSSNPPDVTLPAQQDLQGIRRQRNILLGTYGITR